MTNDKALFPPPGDRKQVEEGDQFTPRFNSRGLVSAVAVDATTGEILMVACMNAEALARTMETGEAVYYSRSRDKLWHKGEQSGHVQKVRQILTDCDQDVILLKVEQVGGCCHTGYRSCFYREVDKTGALTFTQTEKVFDPEQVYGKK